MFLLVLRSHSVIGLLEQKNKLMKILRNTFQNQPIIFFKTFENTNFSKRSELSLARNHHQECPHRCNRFFEIQKSEKLIFLKTRRSRKFQKRKSSHFLHFFTTFIATIQYNRFLEIGWGVILTNHVGRGGFAPNKPSALFCYNWVEPEGL